MTLTSPAEWPRVPDGVVEAARRTALDALRTAPLEQYYDVDGGYAGATFLAAGGNVPDDIDASDLFAVTQLSVDIAAAAARRVLNDGERRSDLLAALRVVPADVPLAAASAGELEQAWEFYLAARRTLANPRAKHSDPWVTAAKLVARKRPQLLPVRDRVVRQVLGLQSHREGRMEILAIRALISDPEILDAIGFAVTRAKRAGEDQNRVCVFDTEPLRILDVALWWQAAAGPVRSANDQ